MATNYWEGLPPTIRIGAHDLIVEIGPKNEMDDKGYVMAGAYSGCEQSIWFYDGAPSKSFAVEISLHEIGHAILAPLGLDEDEEERICTMIGGGLTQVFRDNKKYLEWLSDIGGSNGNGNGGSPQSQ